MKFDNIGRLKLFLMGVYYNKSSLSRIISLSQVKILEDITVKKEKSNRPCVYANNNF